MADLRSLTVAELLRLQGDTLAELRRRGVVRTANAPAGDIAELLVARATGGTLADPSQKGWDVRTPEGELLQVKARLVDDMRRRAKRQLSPFREWTFDAAVIVLFDPSYVVCRAARLPVAELRAAARWRQHVSGYVVHATDELLDRGTDWTARLAGIVISDMID